MTAVGLIAAKGSPGVTTLACAMVLARAGCGAVLVEADPHGGDLALVHGVSQSPGLAELAARTKRAAPQSNLRPYIRPLAGGMLPAVLAPVDGAAVRAALDVLSDRADGLGAHGSGNRLVLDLGQADPDGSRWWASACARVLLVARTDLTGLAHAEVLARHLREVGAGAALAVIDTGPYPPEEAAQVLALPLAAVLPYHPKQARALLDPSTVRAAALTRLVTLAGDLFDTALDDAKVAAA